MRSVLVSFCAAGLATFAHAYTQPKALTWGPLLTPSLSDPVNQGKQFNVTWDPEEHPTDGVTVSLVLCRGPPSNCVLADTAIASGIPAGQKSYDWTVPCDLAPGGDHGMLIIVDGTGEYQYSTQFSCLENPKCSSATPSNTTSSATASGSVIILPPSQQTGSSSAPGNSTAPPTTTGTDGWASATTIITSGSTTYTVGSGSTWASNIPGTTVINSASPATTAAAGTSLASGSTGSASAGAASPSAFAGGAGQLAWNTAGVLVAGAAALFIL
ncbi:hypothetical protein A1O3_05218 [Capronia epimyces CBS 606.96]|uniref:Yeast cell wall synthesis Kre9/Knh1-like N-terminal domain-containing protein n=1 Tax=Capronia epimyces CBS 606.96 TaxID=1182542 RepID=W9YQK7_9EURO|nr:uncharacterized protein A1O3_05218 [Capronia epimyces CBS 606.96]EXJ84549.1 hypothetical protein A1O3_05218 [Capronia epimyces CBS 606.96]